MSKRTRSSRKSLNSASPSTPKHVSRRDDDNMFATPKTHYIDDDDSDSSPYCLSFSQRAMRTGVEVTWGEPQRTKSTPFKSKSYEQRDSESPPTKICVEPLFTESRTPKGLFKFKIGLERLAARSQIEKDSQSICALNVESNVIANKTDSNSTSPNDSNFYTALEQVGETNANINDSANLKQFLNDSEDMDLILCSQKIEQEYRRTEPVILPIASKGFADAFCDDDDSFLANLDDPLLINNKLPPKTLFVRHKSIAIHPNTPTVQGTNSTSASKQNSNNFETKAGSAFQVAKKIDPITPLKRPSTTPSKPLLVRHKSMPSPVLTISETTKKCTAAEIALKRDQALARLKQSKLKKREYLV